MTNEYVRAVVEQGLRYADLKQIVRDSVHYSFLPGASLWRARAGGAKLPVCGVETAACKAFLAANPKAAKEQQLERELAAFEARVQ
jgi:adenosine deaminase